MEEVSLSPSSHIPGHFFAAAADRATLPQQQICAPGTALIKVRTDIPALHALKDMRLPIDLYYRPQDAPDIVTGERARVLPRQFVIAAIYDKSSTEGFKVEIIDMDLLSARPETELKSMVSRHLKYTKLLNACSELRWAEIRKYISEMSDGDKYLIDDNVLCLIIRRFEDVGISFVDKHLNGKSPSKFVTREKLCALARVFRRPFSSILSRDIPQKVLNIFSKSATKDTVSTYMLIKQFFPHIIVPLVHSYSLQELVSLRGDVFVNLFCESPDSMRPMLLEELRKSVRTVFEDMISFLTENYKYSKTVLNHFIDKHVTKKEVDHTLSGLSFDSILQDLRTFSGKSYLPHRRAMLPVALDAYAKILPNFKSRVQLEALGPLISELADEYRGSLSNFLQEHENKDALLLPLIRHASKQKSTAGVLYCELPIWCQEDKEVQENVLKADIRAFLCVKPRVGPATWKRLARDSIMNIHDDCHKVVVRNDADEYPRKLNEALFYIFGFVPSETNLRQLENLDEDNNWEYLRSANDRVKFREYMSQTWVKKISYD